MNEETIKFPKIDKVTRQDKVTPIYGTCGIVSAVQKGELSSA